MLRRRAGQRIQRHLVATHGANSFNLRSATSARSRQNCSASSGVAGRVSEPPAALLAVAGFNDDRGICLVGDHLAKCVCCALGGFCDNDTGKVDVGINGHFVAPVDRPHRPLCLLACFSASVMGGA